MPWPEDVELLVLCLPHHIMDHLNTDAHVCACMCLHTHTTQTQYNQYIN